MLTFPGTDEIREILIKRVDRHKQAVGIVVGLIEPHGRRVVAHGNLATEDPRTLDADTIFEIGSITKVFTSLLLADMVNRNEVALDDPASKYLPDNVTMPQRNGRSITLLDLSTHRSALPPMPANQKPEANYAIDDLYRFLSGYTLPRDPGSEYEYSNLGAGLLGHLLACRAGTDYESLVRNRIAQPLSMPDTSITLSSSMRQRMAVGHNAMLTPVAGSDVPMPFAGAGALRSSVNDMLTFLQAFLGHTESPLAPAMKAMLEVRRSAGKATIALGWITMSIHGREIVGHNGATAGFRSFAGYDPEKGIGVVILSNASTAAGIDDIGFHLLNPNAPLADLDPPQEHMTDPILLDRYTGRYQLPDRILEITRSGNRLFLQVTAAGGKPIAGPIFEMFPESESVFFVKMTGGRISFETGPDGRATGLIMHRADRGPTPAPRLS